MIRKERERPADFAWSVLAEAPYAVLSLADHKGIPYGVPVSPVADREYGVIYFHCAKAGKKMELLRNNPKVCLSAVSQARSVPGEFEMSFRSAVFSGTAEIVEDEAEKVKALLLLCTHYDPTGMERFDSVMEKEFPAVCVVKITPNGITGKEAKVPGR